MSTKQNSKQFNLPCGDSFTVIDQNPAPGVRSFYVAMPAPYKSGWITQESIEEAGKVVVEFVSANLWNKGN